MLARAGFGNHTLLAHAPCQQRLADGVVDLVRAGVVEVFALEVDLRAAILLAQSLGVIDRAGTAHIVLQFVFELGHEVRIIARLVVLDAQFFQRCHQRFGDKDAAIRTKVAVGIRKVSQFHHPRNRSWMRLMVRLVV